MGTSHKSSYMVIFEDKEHASLLRSIKNKNHFNTHKADSAKIQRGRFSTEEKLYILEQADECRNTAEISILLRKYDLSPSHLAIWARQRNEGTLSTFVPCKLDHNSDQAEIAILKRRIIELEQEQTELEERLLMAEKHLSFLKFS